MIFYIEITRTHENLRGLYPHEFNPTHVNLRGFYPYEINPTDENLRMYWVLKRTVNRRRFSFPPVYLSINDKCFPLDKLVGNIYYQG